MPAGGGGQQDNDNSLGPVWMLLGIFVAGAFVWYFFAKEIIEFVFTLRMYEADAISIFVPSMWAHNLDVAKDLMVTAKQADYSGVGFDTLLEVSYVVGSYWRYPVIVILLGLAGLVYLRNPLSKFKKVYSMKTLLAHEKSIWPFIMPVASLDLVHQDIHKGPWAMAMNPMAFAKHYKLLIFDKPKSSLDRFKSKEQPTASVNRDEARRIFAMQVGRFWSGPEALPIHARALYAVFCARVNGDRDGAAKLLEQIAYSAAGAKLNFSGTDTLLRKHKDNKQIIKLTKRHAFELTIMASLLDFARQDGVLASADFLWLKPVDRRLWFLLNCVGRQTPFAEVAGIFAHWVAEIEFGKPLNVPMVEEAVNGLEMAMKELIYHEDEEDE